MVSINSALNAALVGESKLLEEEQARLLESLTDFEQCRRNEAKRIMAGGLPLSAESAENRLRWREEENKIRNRITNIGTVLFVLRGLSQDQENFQNPVVPFEQAMAV